MGAGIHRGRGPGGSCPDEGEAMESEERLANLESTVAFQDRTIEQLSQVVTALRRAGRPTRDRAQERARPPRKRGAAGARHRRRGAAAPLLRSRPHRGGAVALAAGRAGPTSARRRGDRPGSARSLRSELDRGLGLEAIERGEDLVGRRGGGEVVTDPGDAPRLRRVDDRAGLSPRRRRARNRCRGPARPCRSPGRRGRPSPSALPRRRRSAAAAARPLRRRCAAAGRRCSSPSAARAGARSCRRRGGS